MSEYEERRCSMELGSSPGDRGGGFVMGVPGRLKRAVRCLAVGLFGLLELVGLPPTPQGRGMKRSRKG